MISICEAINVTIVYAVGTFDGFLSAIRVCAANLYFPGCNELFFAGVEPRSYSLFDRARLDQKVGWQAELSWLHQILARCDDTKLKHETSLNSCRHRYNCFPNADAIQIARSQILTPSPPRSFRLLSLFSGDHSCLLMFLDHHNLCK